VTSSGLDIEQIRMPRERDEVRYSDVFSIGQRSSPPAAEAGRTPS
jgi:hypothetical protein